MHIKKFEDIIAWQKSRILSCYIYKSFDDSKDWGFKDQIQRASISVMNNIAEGFGRRTNNEFRAFLYIARGSLLEVKSMLYIAFDIGYITDNQFEKLYYLADELSRIIYGFIKKLSTEN